jgi:hypothetical protein
VWHVANLEERPGAIVYSPSYSQIQIDSRVFVRCSLQTLFTVQISLSQLGNAPLPLASCGPTSACSPSIDNILCCSVHQSFLSTEQYIGPTSCMRATPMPPHAIDFMSSSAVGWTVDGSLPLSTRSHDKRYKGVYVLTIVQHQL